MTLRNYVVVGALASIAIAGSWYLVARAELLTSPQKTIGSALDNLMQSNARKVDAQIDIATSKNAALNFKAQGVVERSADNKIAYDGTVAIKNHRKAIDLNFQFLLRHLNEGTYLNIKEMPATSDIKEDLFDQWLILREAEQYALPDTSFVDLANYLTEQKIITSVIEDDNDTVSGKNAKKYRVEFDQEKLRQAINDAARNKNGSQINVKIYERAALILNNFNLTDLSFWVAPGKELAKVSVRLIPKEEKLRESSVSVSLEFSLVDGQPPIIEQPATARKFSGTGVLWRLITVGSR